MEAIKTVDLTKRYKALTAVDKLNLEIRKGELFCLLGVNGAGKTTVIKMLSCLTKPTSGDAFVGGHSITGDELQVKSIIGVSPQETAIAPNLSVKENLELICMLHGFSKERCQAKIRELSEQFGLCDILPKKAGKLSGGWQRRVSIAMALIGEPDILFLDESNPNIEEFCRMIQRKDHYLDYPPFLFLHSEQPLHRDYLLRNIYHPLKRIYHAIHPLIFLLH